MQIRYFQMYKYILIILEIPLVDKLFWQIIEFNYGMKDRDPIDQVRFYDKNCPNNAVRVKKDQVRFDFRHKVWYRKIFCILPIVRSCE